MLFTLFFVNWAFNDGIAKHLSHLFSIWCQIPCPYDPQNWRLGCLKEDPQIIPKKSCRFLIYLYGENFMAIFTTLSAVIWFSTGTLGIFATLVCVFTMRVVINDILSMAIIPTLSTSILFCNLCYILLWISPRSVVKITIRI